jgi:hypothetical protein
LNGIQPARGQAHLPDHEIFCLVLFSSTLCLSIYFLDPAISGFGFLSAVKYVVRGLVFKSASNE